MRKLALELLAVTAGLSAAVLCQTTELDAQSTLDIPEKYLDKFVYRVDNRDYFEKFFNKLGITSNDVGRGFALIAGASDYPELRGESSLSPAEVDRDRLVAFLSRFEFFDEIVVLWNEDVTTENFEYFLQVYFPQRLEASPKSRFLFAYSGHGFAKRNLRTSYLLKNSARNLRDRANAINLHTLKTYIDETRDAAHHTLVLINACYGGAFLRRAFGGEYIPREPGAHAITAGSAEQQTWHDPLVGKGSIFFEKILAGVEDSGRADASRGGLITVYELFAYLRNEVKAATDQAQVPRLGDISADGSVGGFFFLDRRRPLDLNVPGEWQPAKGTAMGLTTIQSRFEYEYIHDGTPCLGFVEKTADAEWKEHTSGEQGCLETEYSFQQVGRDGDWIVLYDIGRKYYARLRHSGGWYQGSARRYGPWSNLHFLQPATEKRQSREEEPRGIGRVNEIAGSGAALPMRVDFKEVPASLVAGKTAFIVVEVTSRPEAPIMDAEVELHADGWFLESGKNTVRGFTNAHGFFVATWRSPPGSRRGYRHYITANIKKDGFGSITKRTSVRVSQDREESEFIRGVGSYQEVEPYSENCRARPEGTYCLAFEDGYLWLIEDPVLAFRTVWDGSRKVVCAVGDRALYCHIIGTKRIREEWQPAGLQVRAKPYG